MHRGWKSSAPRVVFCRKVFILQTLIKCFLPAKHFTYIDSLNLHNSPRDSYELLGPICGEGNGTPLQHSCLENPMDGGAWCAAVHGVARSRAQLSDFTFTFHFHALEMEMATHSSVLAWRIPGMVEPGGLPSMGLHRVGHDLAAAAGPI